uniref:Uncharacterized protein n=1 Tax=Arundo donax TaxID=35708 RepID=A0A0A9AJ10_ARUDO
MQFHCHGFPGDTISTFCSRTGTCMQLISSASPRQKTYWSWACLHGSQEEQVL